MTALALVIVVDVFVAAFVLGLVHCKDVPVAALLPRRVPGAALVDNPPPKYETPEESAAWVANLEALGTLNGGPLRPFPYVAPSQTIGDRARARGATAVQQYYAGRLTDNATMPMQGGFL